MYDHLISKGLNYISSWSYVSMACFIKVFKHAGDPVKAVLYGKMKGAQYSYSALEKSRVASLQFVWKKLRFSSHPRARVRHQGSPGTARAQPSWPVNCWLIGLINWFDLPKETWKFYLWKSTEKNCKFNYCKSKMVVSGMKWVNINIILVNTYIW